MGAIEAAGSEFDGDLQAAVDSNPLWYHTMELAPGVVTPGWFDLRPIVERMPWPDVRGKRCLDVGTWDGFLAFELERRGASEVVCTDLSDDSQWDWTPDLRQSGPEVMAAFAGPEKGRGFAIARQALGSSVQRVESSIYDLSADTVGRFDVVVCGSLLLHLRDPLRALEALRSVCEGVLLSAEEVRLGLSVRHPQRPLAELDGHRVQWWLPNVAGHRRMVMAAGFEIERATRPYSIPFGPSHPPSSLASSTRARLTRRVLTGHFGVPAAAVLARPQL
ncbi:MAG: tRNA (mo5U34)-methyltransferase [Solirubrobacteraceae bacterium]|jgi:tRNA (mo5U34)-methyltransferase|nr:tRNA (mo5U34)-methyltransferase [Solirubrobacteraceae bacterium]